MQVVLRQHAYPTKIVANRIRNGCRQSGVRHDEITRVARTARRCFAFKTVLSRNPEDGLIVAWRASIGTIVPRLESLLSRQTRLKYQDPPVNIQM
jgi:hypothetical protein